MLSSVTDYVLWLLGTAIPAFLTAEPVRIFIALMCLSVVLGFVAKFLRPPKI